MILLQSSSEESSLTLRVEAEQKKNCLFLCFYLKEIGFVVFYRVPRDIKTGSSDPVTSLCSVFHILSALSGRNDWFSFCSAMDVQGREVWFITDMPLSLVLKHAHIRGLGKECSCNWDYSRFPVMLEEFADYREMLFINKFSIYQDEDRKDWERQKKWKDGQGTR